MHRNTNSPMKPLKVLIGKMAETGRIFYVCPSCRNMLFGVEIGLCACARCGQALALLTEEADDE